jgi:small subunit ribosomal protein S3
MGQKVNPISNRLGIIRGWDSNWYGGNNYGDTLLEDSKLRKYLYARLAKTTISRIVIERTLKLITITVCTSRPGFIIGKAGSEADKLKEELKKITDKDVQLNIYEIKRPELEAALVANNIARQLEGKIQYRRAIKMAIGNTMRSGAEGIKVMISGRINGAEIARSEMYKEGRTPLHTFRADIDYALGEALTKVGLLGIKVWICRGEVYDKRDLAPSFEKEYGNRGGDGGYGGGRDGDKSFKRKRIGERDGGRYYDNDREGDSGGERGERRERSSGGNNRGGGNRGGGGGFGGGGNRGGGYGGNRTGGGSGQSGNRGG